jgi:hypothetical protein
MIITNKLGLPRAFVEMAKRDYEYVDGAYHATELLKPIRAAILERRHHDEIEVDVADLIWLLFGKAVHNILEYHNVDDYEFKEDRIEIRVRNSIVTGKFDLYNAKTQKVTDYKTCSVWKVIFKDYEDYRRQLLTYGKMLEKIGFQVQHGEIIALMKDHSKSKAKYDKDYPQYPVKRIKFQLWEEDYKEHDIWLTERVKAFEAAEKLPDDKLPLCTPEERFNSGDKYAVMKGKNKRAMRVLDSMEEAEEWMQANGGTHIDIRPGEDKKCIDYCSACEFCDHYRENVAKEEIRKEA